MSDVRTVPVARFEIEALDKAIRALYREHDNESATRLGLLLLRWQSLGTPVFAELTERETRGADGSEWPPRPRSVSFACSADDIDESGGLADVVPLDSWSKRVHHVQQATIHGAGSE